MIRTKNRKTVIHTAKKSMRANRKRNIIIACAIVLTTLLITAVFTAGFSINKSIEWAQMKTVGGDAHASFQYLTPDEAEKIAQHPSIKEYGKRVVVGEVMNKRLKEKRVEVLQADEQVAKHFFIDLIKGELPKREQEIVLNTWTLDLLGVPHKIGEKIRLDLDINGEKVSKDFILSGYYKADQHVAMAGLAFVSQDFIKSNLNQIDPQETRKTGTYTNTTTVDVMFHNAWGLEKKAKKVMADTGVDANYGVNWAYSSTTLSENIQMLIPLLVLVLIIMLSGYLLIYNIFHIAVVQDIKFYGLLKTIGTTPKQLKKIISIQANRLYIIALPIGMVLGYGVGMWVTSMASTTLSGINDSVIYSVHPIIFVGAALFSYVTVRVAASKPGKMAAKISPVEAVKFSGVTKIGKKKTKRSVHGATLTKMAMGNLLRQKKKLFLMLASVSLSIVLFSIVYTVISSINVNKYLNSFISGDFVVMETQDGSTNIEGGDPLTEEVAEELRAVDGVKNVDFVYFTETYMKMNGTIKNLLKPLAASEDPDQPIYRSVLENGKISTELSGISRGWYDVLRENDIVAGTFNPEKFASGQYVLVTQAFLAEEEEGDLPTYFTPGDRIHIDTLGKSYEVMAVGKLDAFYAAGTKSYVPAGIKIYLPVAELKDTDSDAQILSLTLHVEPESKDHVELAAQAITDSSSGLILKSRDDYKEELSGFIRVFKSIGYGLSFIIAFIGVMNYINTMITGILSRRNELAVLESIGMTKKQLKKLLFYEGLLSVMLTGMIVLTAGLYITYAVGKGITESMDFTEFQMSIWPTSLAILLLMTISITITWVAYSLLSKDTIIERLREVE